MEEEEKGINLIFNVDAGKLHVYIMNMKMFI